MELNKRSQQALSLINLKANLVEICLVLNSNYRKNITTNFTYTVLDSLFLSTILRNTTKQAYINRQV